MCVGLMVRLVLFISWLKCSSLFVLMGLLVVFVIVRLRVWMLFRCMFCVIFRLF